MEFKLPYVLSLTEERKKESNFPVEKLMGDGMESAS